MLKDRCWKKAQPGELYVSHFFRFFFLFKDVIKQVLVDSISKNFDKGNGSLDFSDCPDICPKKKIMYTSHNYFRLNTLVLVVIVGTLAK